MIEALVKDILCPAIYAVFGFDEISANLSFNRLFFLETIFNNTFLVI